MKFTVKKALLSLVCSLALPLNANANNEKVQAPSAEQLTIERIYSSPSLNGQTPKSLKFSPDGTRVTYLQGKAEDLHRYDLWEYNLASKENKPVSYTHLTLPTTPYV